MICGAIGLVIQPYFSAMKYLPFLLLCLGLVGAKPVVKKSATAQEVGCRLDTIAYENWKRYLDSMQSEDLPALIDREIEADPRMTTIRTRDQILVWRVQHMERVKRYPNNWARTANYLWTDPAEAERIVRDFGFDSGRYFSYFLTDYPGDNPCREQLLANMRDSIYTHRQDSAVYRLDDSNLCALSFRTFIKVRLLHEH